MCEANIEAACSTNLPSINETLISECEMHMEAFSNLTKQAIAASGEASCQLWTADELAMAASKIKGAACDISDLNTNFTMAKKNCTQAFGACRKVEDKVAKATHLLFLYFSFSLVVSRNAEQSAWTKWSEQIFVQAPQKPILTQ